MLQTGIACQKQPVVEHDGIPQSATEHDDVTVRGLQDQQTGSFVFGLMADSPVTLPRKALPRKSPAPFTPVLALTLPTDHCMAPACTVMGAAQVR
ncbi:MAG: hypothetical protein ACLT98_07515 [Eggerthellaceae bacterium]